MFVLVLYGRLDLMEWDRFMTVDFYLINQSRDINIVHEKWKSLIKFAFIGFMKNEKWKGSTCMK